jgi:hypothetical protein
MQGLEEDISNYEQKQVEEVHKCITSTSTGNCAAVSNSSAHVSEEGEKETKKRNRRRKKKSKAKDSENGYVVMNSLLKVLYIYLCVYIVLNSDSSPALYEPCYFS